ncbi:MAG: hypothetical protein Q8O72_11385, partial [Bacteroidales bacterium]|nr:hypothetical protein [Bacteroidales bacterium]
MRGGEADEAIQSGLPRSRWSLAMTPIAHADDPSPDGPLCERNYIAACCPINQSDGSFECWANKLPQKVTNEQGDGWAKYFVYVVKKDGSQISEPVAEAINHNLIYTRTAPRTMAEGPAGVVYSLVEDKGIRITHIDGRMRVAGDKEKGYRDFDAGNSLEVAYQPENGDLAFRRAKEGISLAETILATDIDTEIALAYGIYNVVDSGEVVTVDDAKEYTVLKRSRDGKLRFGVEVQDDKHWGRVYGVTDTKNDFVEFIKPEWKQETIPFRRTVTFDVDANNTALVVFQDEEGLYRLRMANPGTKLPNKKLVKFGGEVSFVGNHDFRELIIYKGQNGIDKEVNSGRALLLDSAENNVWLVKYYVDGSTMNGELQHLLPDFLDEPTMAIPVGTNPIDMVLSKDSKTVYVLNQGNKTISILSLADGDKTLSIDDIKKNTQTISLKDYLGEKNVYLVPTSLAYRDSDKGDYLLVGSEGINGAIVINLNSIPVPRAGLEP